LNELQIAEQRIKVLENFIIYAMNCCGGEISLIPSEDSFPDNNFQSLYEYLVRSFDQEIEGLMIQIDAADEENIKLRNMLTHFIPGVDLIPNKNK
jgi:hypothetical protein